MPGTGEPPRTGAIDLAIRLGALAAFVVLVGVLIRPFAGLLLWSAILAVALQPVFAWISARIGGRRRLAAVLVTVLALLVVFGPAAYLVTSLVDSLEQMAAAVKAGTFALPPLPQALARLPLIGPQLADLWSSGIAGATDLLKAHGKDLVRPGEVILKLIAGLAGTIATFALAVLAAGFLFVPGPRLAGLLGEAALRIAGPRGGRFVAVAAATVRGVARGIIGVALLQGLLMGTVMMVAGIPHAGLLAVAALILSLAQIGAIVVGAPVILWVWFAHSTVFAVVFTAVLLPLATMEIPLKPLAMGQGLGTPMVVVLAGLFGGTVAFGLPGLFLGPMVLAVAWELLAFWLTETAAAPGREQ